jgi:hypothetical protein
MPMAAQRKVEPLILVRSSDRIFITGASGSGKTRLLSRVLIPTFAHFPVVLDPKGDFPAIKGVERTSKYRPGRAQILHIPRREQSVQVWETVIDRVLDRGNQTLVIDDIYAINGGNANPRPNLLWAISGGRSIGVPTWVGVQRPARLPVSVLSESEHYFIFPLRHAEDVKTIAANTSPNVAAKMPGLGEHDFIYYRTRPPRKLIIVPGNVW